MFSLYFPQLLTKRIYFICALNLRYYLLLKKDISKNSGLCVFKLSLVEPFQIFLSELNCSSL